MEGFGQSGNFVHIQSENGQPFIAKCNDTSFNSSSNGYLVIPQVAKGDQSIIIQFPGTNYPDYLFVIKMDTASRGFTLKLGIDNSWSMFDIVQLQDLKGTILLNQNKTINTSNSINADEKPLIAPIIITSPAATLSASRDTSIQKIFEKVSLRGLDLVFVIKNNGQLDTVAIFIPAEVNKQPGAVINKLLPFSGSENGRLWVFYNNTDYIIWARASETIKTNPYIFSN